MRDRLLQRAPTLKAELHSINFWQENIAMRAYFNQEGSAVHTVFPPGPCRTFTRRAGLRLCEGAVFKYNALFKASGMQER